MNVMLPEKVKIKKKELFIYISIIVICIACVIVAFYVQFYARIDIGRLIGIKPEGEFGKKSEEEIQILKTEFNQIFTNNIENDEGQNDSKKEEQDKQLVYTGYEKKESKLNSFDLEVHIPHINIKSEIVDGYNKEIEDVFLKIANNVLESENQNIIFTVEYVANVQDGILSVMIRSNLKEGSKAQKVIIQTYNYDLRNNKEITLEEVLKIENLDKEVIQNTINEEIAIEQKKAEDLISLGYNIYKRDKNSEIYKIENSTEFYLTNNTLYIVYAYGNATDTSEMDLIII